MQAAHRHPLTPELDRELTRDLKTLTLFIRVYCKHKHSSANRQPVELVTHDVQRLAGRPVELCEDCRKLLTHALVKRSNCAMEPKPMCKHCPNHCYHPTYRAKIRDVMKFSGRRLVLTGRLDYLFHLLF